MITEAFWCEVHRRGLTWWEWKSGGCFWCDPGLIPMDEAEKHDTPGWAQRKKVWQSILDLTPDERLALRPSPLPGEGVITPSQAMLARWAEANSRA